MPVEYKIVNNEYTSVWYSGSESEIDSESKYVDESVQLTAYVILKDPVIKVIPNFLCESEINEMIKIAETGWRPSTVGRGPDNYSDMDDLVLAVSKNRTSESYMVRHRQNDIIRRVERRVAALAGVNVSQVERLNMVRYFPGQFFGIHHDGKFRPSTVFVYLNDLLEEDDEGSTFFPNLNIKVKPTRGMAVFWYNINADGTADNRLIHTAEAPTKKVKYAINCFVNEQVMWDSDQPSPVENDTANIVPPEGAEQKNL